MLLRHTSVKFWPRGACWTLGLLALTMLPATLAGSQTKPADRAAQVKWQPMKLVNGSPVLFQITTSNKVQSLSASWFGHDFAFFHPAGGKIWYALVGVPVETAPGRYDLIVKETLAAGKSAEVRVKIKVAGAAYPKITIKVAKQFTEPDPEQLREIAADKDVKQ